MKVTAKTKVLFVLPQLGAGGSERVVLDLARNLSPSSFEIHVAFFETGPLENSFARVCRGLCQILKKPGFDLGAMLKLSEYISEKKIDVVNAHHYMPFFYSFLGTKILNRSRLYYTEHSVPEVLGVVNSKHRGIFNILAYQLDSVIGISREISETFKEKFPVHSLRVTNIVNGVDTERFAMTVDRELARAEWGLSPDHFVVGLVANFRKVKNHACLVRAFRRLGEKFPSLRLFFVGKGYWGEADNSEEELSRYIKHFGLQDRIVFAGHQEDIPKFLKMFDVFCLPSFSEGLPVSILEAMASGVPVVGSRVSGIREVVDDGESGMLFPMDDDETLANILGLLIENSNLRDTLSRKGLEFVQKSHGLEAWISRYEQVFNNYH